MVHLLPLLLHAVRTLFADRTTLALENLALRQQVAVLKSRRPRPRLSVADRLFWVWLRRVWAGWSEALLIVQPDTVVRWHREGFRLWWRWRSRRRGPGRPRVDAELRRLIARMARDNPTRGAPRITGELAKLGFRVSERTVSRYLPKRPPPPGSVQRWLTFLLNHRDAIAAADFFTVSTATFQVLHVFFVIHHDRRRLLHFNVTAHPSAAWIVQQLREAFPWDQAPRFLVLDRDGKYGTEVYRWLDAARIRLVHTAPRCPWQNGVAERWIGSVRRELLDHVVVLNAQHLQRLLNEYADYYAEDRTHLGLDGDTPAQRAVERRPGPDAAVVAEPRVGGLHHRYCWRRAA